jgi:threonylcarbamoyladenosine tRNA methylthiotransferase MtaB
VQSGHKEIVITGLFLGAYGRPTALRKRFAAGPSPLAELVRAVSNVEGLLRLRLSSLEPGDVEDSLLEVLATRPNCVPHLHLPLQSGSPAVLRRMNRQYTQDAFLAMIDRVRAALDQPAITTDIIVGFPGESEADFAASVDVARYARFCKIHAFPFSPREKTAAARWQDQFVPRRTVQARMRRMAAADEECSLAYRASLVGRRERVIVEEVALAGEGTYVCSGRADRYFKIWFESSRLLKRGDVVKVRVDRVTPTRTHASGPDASRGSYSLFVLSNSRA